MIMISQQEPSLKQAYVLYRADMADLANMADMAHSGLTTLLSEMPLPLNLSTQPLLDPSRLGVLFRTSPADRIVQATQLALSTLVQRDC